MEILSPMHFSSETYCGLSVKFGRNKNQLNKRRHTWLSKKMLPIVCACVELLNYSASSAYSPISPVTITRTNNGWLFSAFCSSFCARYVPRRALVLSHNWFIHTTFAVIKIRPIFHARDLSKLARSFKQLRLLFQTDPWNLPGTTLFIGLRKYLSNVVLFVIKDL